MKHKNSKNEETQRKTGMDQEKKENKINWANPTWFFFFFFKNTNKEQKMRTEGKKVNIFTSTK